MRSTIKALFKTALLAALIIQMPFLNSPAYAQAAPKTYPLSQNLWMAYLAINNTNFDAFDMIYDNSASNSLNITQMQTALKAAPAPSYIYSQWPIIQQTMSSMGMTATCCTSDPGFPDDGTLMFSGPNYGVSSANSTLMLPPEYLKFIVKFQSYSGSTPAEVSAAIAQITKEAGGNVNNISDSSVCNSGPDSFDGSPVYELGYCPSAAKVKGLLNAEVIAVQAQYTTLDELYPIQVYLDNLMTNGPSMAKALKAGDYATLWSLGAKYKLVLLLETPVGLGLLGATKFTQSQMVAFYNAAAPYWIGSTLGTNPYPPTEWGDPGKLASDANVNYTTSGDNTLPDIARFAGKQPPPDFMTKWGIPIIQLALTAIATCGIGAAIGAAADAAIDSAEVATVTATTTSITTATATSITTATITAAGTIATTVAPTLLGTVVSIGSSAVAGAAIGAMQGENAGNALLSGLEGGIIGNVLAPVTTGISSGLTNVGVNGTVANYIGALTTGTAANALLNGGNLSQAFEGAAVSSGISAITQPSTPASTPDPNMRDPVLEQAILANDAAPVTVNIAGLDAPIGAVDLSNVQMPVVNIPAPLDNSLSPINTSATYLNTAFDNSSAGTFDRSPASVGGISNVDAGSFAASTLGATGAASATVYSVSSDSSFSNVQFNANTPNSTYNSLELTTSVDRQTGSITLANYNGSSTPSYIQYSVEAPNSIVDTNFITIGQVTGDPARPGLGQYLINQVAAQNPGLPIYGDLAQTNQTAFNSAFSDLVNSGAPITPESLADALSQVPAIRSLPGEVSILPQFDAAGNLTNVGILRAPDLTASTVQITNAQQLMDNPQFQNWMSSLSTQPTAGASAANDGLSALRASQGGFIDIGAIGDGLGSLGKVLLPIAGDALNFGGAAVGLIDLSAAGYDNGGAQQLANNIAVVNAALSNPNNNSLAQIGLTDSLNANLEAQGYGAASSYVHGNVTGPIESYVGTALTSGSIAANAAASAEAGIAPDQTAIDEANAQNAQDHANAGQAVQTGLGTVWNDVSSFFGGSSSTTEASSAPAPTPDPTPAPAPAPTPAPAPVAPVIRPVTPVIGIGGGGHFSGGR